MKYLNHHLLALSAVLFTFISSSAQTGNSDYQDEWQSQLPTEGTICNDAILLTCGQTITGSAESSTSDNYHPEIIDCSPLGEGISWFRYSSDTSSPVTLSSCGFSDFQMEIKVFKGQCDQLECVPTIGNCNGFGVEIFFWAEANTGYFIRVGSIGDPVGSFSLSASCTPLIYLPAVPPCVELYSQAYYQTVTADPRCIYLQWDSICQEAYVGHLGISYPCNDPLACNYAPGNCPLVYAFCNYSCYGCTHPDAINLNPSATLDDDSCVFQVSTCVLDLTGDGVIGFADLTAFSVSNHCVSNCPADFNGDGNVDFSDFNLLLNYFGTYCQ